MKLKFKKMYPDVQLPEFATEGSACFDIRAYCPNDYFDLDNADTAIINTGLKVEVPKGYVLKIYSRSGHGFACNIRLVNCVGVIDSDYRGEIKVGLIKDFTQPETSPWRVMHGERIAQGMLEKLVKTEIVEAEELSETERGEGGFGSTGVK